ncbi:hypothetical protein L1987_06153 [Smallanthus sonchifolius]|uniref:Uncharacterized protein n=1 Tax=Smallanthus sonchifolius TaxID=185202 RepID=A0ACB9JXC2_9ASTR|nr:hypothetical protein L1987_06153 [Smallanthus sonchifolius]
MNQNANVIGFVADVGVLKTIRTKKGKDTKKLNRIYLSLWDQYADDILGHWENREENGLIVVILQFGQICGNCWLKVPLTVQDSTGTVYLIVKQQKLLKIHLNGGDKGPYPDEFCDLLKKKFAFKIDIKNFNIDNNFEPDNSVSITNTFNEIPSQETANLKADVEQTPVNITPFPQGVNLKAAIEETDDNVTPFSQNDKCIGKRHVEEATFKRR